MTNTGSRRKARECALQALYQLDVSEAPVEEALGNLWQHFDEPQEHETRRYTELLVRGVVEHKGELDDLVQKHSSHWRVARMARVDRNILRLGAFELRFRDDVPPKVVLNEAIEIAKKFGSEDSGSFINGVLDKLAADVRPPE